MSRRIALPGANELFRSTGDPSRSPAPEEAPDVRAPESFTPPTRPATVTSLPAVDAGLAPVSEEDTDGLEEAANAVRSTSRRRPRAIAERRPSGRERHDEKITVYVSADELMDLEHARLMLRGDHGLPVDRGRVVREALAVVLADFEAKGEASILVRRLRGR
jgi:hypothetical protein